MANVLRVGLLNSVFFGAARFLHRNLPTDDGRYDLLPKGKRFGPEFRIEFARMPTYLAQYWKMSVGKICIRNGWSNVECMRNIIFLIIDFWANDTHRTFSIHFFFLEVTFLLLAYCGCCCCCAHSPKINMNDSSGFLRFQIRQSLCLSWYLLVFDGMLCCCMYACAIASPLEKQFSLYGYILLRRNQPIEYISILRTHSIASYYISVRLFVFYRNSKFSYLIVMCP